MAQCMVTTTAPITMAVLHHKTITTAMLLYLQWPLPAQPDMLLSGVPGAEVEAPVVSVVQEDPPGVPVHPVREESTVEKSLEIPPNTLLLPPPPALLGLAPMTGARKKSVKEKHDDVS